MTNTHSLHFLKMTASLLAGLTALTASRAESSRPLEVCALFGSNSVLQRDRPVPIWGTASPGAEITVSFQGRSVVGTSDASGNWKAILPAHPATWEPAELRISTPGKEPWIATHVLVGDVWLCSGQSNMVFRLRQEAEAEREVPTAHHPLIRLCQISPASAEKPIRDISTQWKVCSPGTAEEFSAVAYFFGKTLSEHLHIPIGLVQSSWGGTPIQSWMARETLEEFPEILRNAEVRWQEAEEQRAVAILKKPATSSPITREGGAPKNKPSTEPAQAFKYRPAGLYNAMIFPLTPMAMRGIIWYQGEANATEPENYRKIFPAMIGQWRAIFEREDLPFYFVQLPNFMRSEDPERRLEWAWQREAQTKALTLPHTGMAVAIDLGDNNDIHPKNKRRVGERLALVALAGTYGLPVQCSGPVLRQTVKEGTRMRLAFSHADGLTLKSAPGIGFELAGSDGVFHPAVGILEGSSIFVSSPGVTEPSRVRYAWHNTPASLIYNSAGLPAAPFHYEVTNATSPLPQPKENSR